MELDKRIKEGKRPLTCFDLKEAEKFIGEDGYFAHEMEAFENLDRCYFSRLLGFDTCDKSIPFAVANASRDYEFFIPAEWVKSEEPEKKYRPYTIKDFEKAFLNDEFDDFIIFRDKNNPEDVYTMRYNGNFRKGEFEYICLGAKNFSFESLFENYEVANYDGEWQPFGVIDEDKE